MKIANGNHKWRPIGGNDDGPNLWQCPACHIVKAVDARRIEYSRPDGEVISGPKNRRVPECVDLKWA